MIKKRLHRGYAYNLKAVFMVFLASKPPLPTIKDIHIALIAPLLQSKSVTIARQYLRYWVVIAAL